MHPVLRIGEKFRPNFRLATFNMATHVGRQCKGSVALIMGLFQASFALAQVSPSFWPYHRNGVLVSGNSVGKQCCTSPALLGWVVW